MNTNKKMGVVLITLSGVGYGLLGIFGKFLYQNKVHPGAALAVRFTIAASLLWCFILLFKREELKKLTKHEVISCLMLGVFGYAVFSSLYFMALEGLSASMTVLLLYTYPIMVALLSFLFLKEKLSPMQKISVPLSFVGIGLLIGGDFAVEKIVSVIFGLLCAFFYASYIVVSKPKLKNIDPVVSACLVQSSAALILVIYHLQSYEILSFTIEHGFRYILGLSLLVTILPMITFAQGIKYLSPSEVSVLYTVEPLVAIGLSSVLFHERMNTVQIIGGLLGLVSMYLITRTSEEK